MKSFFSLFSFVVSSIVLFVSASSLIAQQVQPPEVEWEKTFGGNNLDIGAFVYQTQDNGFIIVGSTYSFGKGFSDIYLIKTDLMGNKEWEKTFGGIYYDEGRCVQETRDGGFIITGESNSFIVGNSHIFLLKTDSLGQEMWLKSFPDDPAEAARAFFVQEIDNGYIVTGNGKAFGAKNTDALLLKTDLSGNKLWAKTFGGEGSDFVYSGKETEDGGFILSGEYGWRLGKSGDLYIIKTDSLGNMIWENTIGEEENEGGTDGQETQDGGYIITGYASTGSGDVYLVKTDWQGNKLWSKTYGGNFPERGLSVREVRGGGYIISGDTFRTGKSDGYIVRTDFIGNKIWEKTLGGNEYDGTYSIQQTRDGGFIAVGKYNQLENVGGDIYLVKLYPEQNLPPTPLHYFNTAKTLAAWEQLRPPYREFNPENPTLFIMHGWNKDCNTSLNDPDGGQKGWLNRMADELHARLGDKVNILAWDWLEEAKSTDGSCGNLNIDPRNLPFSEIPNQAKLATRALKKVFASAPTKYAQPIHLIGHSLGAYVISLVGTELMQDYKDLENDIYIPSQVSLFDPADIALGGVWLDSAVETLRINNVYLDLYHGVTSEGDHGCNVWVDVPQGSFNPLNWHFVYEWYQYTVSGAVNPKIFTSLGWLEKNPLVGTLGFEMSPLSDKSRPLNMCGLDKLETLLFMKPIGRVNGASWDPDDFVQIGQRCSDFTPLVNNGPVPVTLGTFAGDGSGEKLTDTSIRMTTASPIAFTLPITIDPTWDYMKFSYNFISAPQKSELTLTLHLLSNDEKRPLFYMSSDAALNLGWNDAGPFSIADIRGESVEFIFEFTSLAPNAVIEIKDLMFLTDAGHFTPQPKANAGPDRAIRADASGVNALTLDASASEGENLRFWWTQNNLFLIDGKTPDIYLALGAYEIGLTVKDDFDRSSEDSVIVEIEYEFTRGDANADGGKPDITDAIAILEWLFLKSTAPLCQDAADIDDNADVDLSDPINLLYFLFLGKAAPKPPYPTAGLNPTPDMLGCDIKPQ